MFACPSSLSAQCTECPLGGSRHTARAYRLLTEACPCVVNLGMALLPASPKRLPAQPFSLCRSQPGAWEAGSRHKC